MGREDLGPISQYNSLTDPYLQGYYSKSIIRHHLKQTGLINRKGEIIPEEIWRKRIATKERMEQASRIIANRIVKQAIEIKNLEKAELRTAMDILAKKELVRRIRGKSIESRNPPRLWPDQNNYQTRDSEDKRIYSTLQRDEPRIDSIEDDQDYGRRYNTYVQRERSRSRPKHRRRIGQRSRSKKGRSQFKRSFSAAPKQEAEPITVTMLYYGKGINIPFDTQVFDSRDEISVYQQHCGGENLLVYTGLVEPGKKFNFVSRRHKEYPFSLTIFINGTYDCRISTCCEYKHKLNIRIGGPSGRFAVTNVTGKNPCIKCLMEKAEEEKKRQRKNKKNRSVEKEYDSEFEDDKKETTTKKNEEASRKVSRSSSISSEKPPVEIPIRHLNDSDSDSYSPKQDSPKNKANGTRKSSWSSKSSSDEKVKSQRYHKDDVINVIEGRKSETKGSKHSQSSASEVPSSSSSAASTARSDKNTKTTTAAATIVNAVKSKRSSESSKSSKSSISDSKSSLNSSSSRDKAKKTNVVESKPPLSTKKAPSKSSSSDIFSSDDSKASTPKNNDSKRSTPVAKSPSFMERVEKKIENLSNNILGTEKGRSSKQSSRSETPTTPTRNKSPSTPKRNKSPSTPTKQDNPSVMVSNKPNKKASSPASSRDRSVTPTTPTRNKSPSTPTRNKSPSSPTKQDNPSVVVKSSKPNKKSSSPLFSGESSSSDESIFDSALNKKNHPEKEKSTTNTTKANEEQTKLPSRISSSSSSSSSSTPSSTARSEKKEAEKPKETNVEKKSGRDALENARKSSSSRSSNRSFGSENRYSPTVRNNENRNTYSPSHMRNS